MSLSSRRFSRVATYFVITESRSLVFKLNCKIASRRGDWKLKGNGETVRYGSDLKFSRDSFIFYVDADESA